MSMTVEQIVDEALALPSEALADRDKTDWTYGLSRPLTFLSGALSLLQSSGGSWSRMIAAISRQKFAGALDGQRARKGIFITTSDFSRDAEDYVSRIDKKIILIDGKTMARLMIDFGVGVATVSAYEVKKLDSDYFEVA